MGANNKNSISLEFISCTPTPEPAFIITLTFAITITIIPAFPITFALAPSISVGRYIYKNLPKATKFALELFV